jgi:hypothetical protein
MDRSEETLDAVRQKLITRSKDKTPAIRIQATGISFLEYSFEAALTVVRDALLQALAALANMQDPHKKDEVYDTFVRMLDEDPKPYGLVFALYIFLPPSLSLSASLYCRGGFHLTCCREVRKAALQQIIVNKATVADIVKRTRDVALEVRYDSPCLFSTPPFFSYQIAIS